MNCKVKKIKLDYSSVQSITQYNGRFTITIRGFRRNRRGRDENYVFVLSNVEDYWLKSFLKMAQEKIGEYKQSVVAFASRFGV